MLFFSFLLLSLFPFFFSHDSDEKKNHRRAIKNRYYYKIADAPQLPGGTAGGSPYFGSFKIPKAAFPLRIGIAGDPGQLVNSTVTRDILIAQKPDVLLITGDVVGPVFFEFFCLVLRGVKARKEERAERQSAKRKSQRKKEREMSNNKQTISQFSLLKLKTLGNRLTLTSAR